VTGPRPLGSRPRQPGSGAPAWDAVYERRGETGVSWYQAVPEVSLELVQAAGGARGRAVLDVGGGMSRLAGALLARGAADVAVLDVSAVALERARARLDDSDARRVRRIHADVLDWTPDRRYDLWHDRAAFHFLVDAGDRGRYGRVLRAALGPGGHAIVGTFAADGPTRCSGRPVARYDPEGLRSAVGDGLAVVASRRELHSTPGGSRQPFTWVLLRAGEG
jgi:SAM-dependent methyltransferase